MAITSSVANKLIQWSLNNIILLLLFIEVTVDMHADI